MPPSAVRTAPVVRPPFSVSTVPAPYTSSAVMPLQDWMRPAFTMALALLLMAATPKVTLPASRTCAVWLTCTALKPPPLVGAVEPRT